jgi:hypothetical protein
LRQPHGNRAIPTNSTASNNARQGKRRGEGDFALESANSNSVNCNVKIASLSNMSTNKRQQAASDQLVFGQLWADYTGSYFAYYFAYYKV